MDKAGPADRARRHYGLDWLRIGAFGLLIFYHIGMFFVSWPWHVKTLDPVEWLEWPMLVTNPWRLALLFVISGVASRHLLAKLRPGRFFGQRSGRLLIPLAAGMILFVAPQPWAQIAEATGYPHGFGYYWLNDYFTFRNIAGADMPTWNHLWFVAYLWIYSALAAAAAWSLPAATRVRAQAAFNHLFTGWRLLALPIAYILALRLWLAPIFPETHAVYNDWFSHPFYGAAFLFGFALARAPAIIDWSARHWRPLLVVSVAGYAGRMLYNTTVGELDAPPDWATLAAQTARAIQTWTVILGLIGLATAKLDFDAPARRYLTDAVFPFYIAHQTIIIVVGHLLRPYRLGAATEFAIILAATLAGCLVAYELARRSGLLRPLFGLKPPSATSATAQTRARTRPA